MKKRANTSSGLFNTVQGFIDKRTFAYFLGFWKYRDFSFILLIFCRVLSGASVEKFCVSFLKFVFGVITKSSDSNEDN